MVNALSVVNLLRIVFLVRQDPLGSALLSQRQGEKLLRSAKNLHVDVALHFRFISIFFPIFLDFCARSVSHSVDGHRRRKVSLHPFNQGGLGCQGGFGVRSVGIFVKNANGLANLFC